jgi:rubredoxin
VLIEEQGKPNCGFIGACPFDTMFRGWLCNCLQIPEEVAREAAVLSDAS